MANYLVSWHIDIEADSPEEAAEQALQIQIDPESLATHFVVQDTDNPDSDPVSIMLEPLSDRKIK